MRDLTFASAVQAATESGVGLAALARRMEGELAGLTAEQLDQIMSARLQVMKDSVRQGTSEPVMSRSGLTGGDAHRVWQSVERGTALDETAAKAIARSLAAAEVNAAMGRIVAAPTAGSCGVVPGVLLTVSEKLKLSDAKVLDALWVAGLVGQVIQARTGLSGAEAGCQAECGAAAAMAAAGACHLGGGDALACTHAAAMAIKSMLGLVCDPVAGLVEVPCIKRNAGAAAIALAAAEMALAGVRSVIPPDEVVGALVDVGRALPESLRETGDGGLAATPSGRLIARTCGAPKTKTDQG